MELPKTKDRIYRKLGYSPLESAEIVTHLNQLLANYHVHYQKLRNFHWNIKGGDFFELHEIFEKQYNKAKVNIDEVAERIRVFGQTPYSTLHEYLENANIKEVGTDLTSYEMVKEILNDYEILLQDMIAVTDAAIDIGDVGTEDLINTFIKNMEKDHWMFNAWLQQ